MNVCWTIDDQRWKQLLSSLYNVTDSTSRVLLSFRSKLAQASAPLDDSSMRAVGAGARKKDVGPLIGLV
jgi:hypothetical protein